MAKHELVNTTIEKTKSLIDKYRAMIDGGSYPPPNQVIQEFNLLLITANIGLNLVERSSDKDGVRGYVFEKKTHGFPSTEESSKLQVLWREAYLGIIQDLMFHEAEKIVIEKAKKKAAEEEDMNEDDGPTEVVEAKKGTTVKTLKISRSPLTFGKLTIPAKKEITKAKLMEVISEGIPMMLDYSSFTEIRILAEELRKKYKRKWAFAIAGIVGALVIGGVVVKVVYDKSHENDRDDDWDDESTPDSDTDMIDDAPPSVDMIDGITADMVANIL